MKEDIIYRWDEVWLWWRWCRLVPSSSWTRFRRFYAAESPQRHSGRPWAGSQLLSSSLLRSRDTTRLRQKPRWRPYHLSIADAISVRVMRWFLLLCQLCRRKNESLRDQASTHPSSIHVGGLIPTLLRSSARILFLRSWLSSHVSPVYQVSDRLRVER